MSIPLLRIRTATLKRADLGHLSFSLGAETHVDVEVEGMSTGCNRVPLETWLWLRLLVGPLVEWSVAHGHLPPDGIAVHLVQRAAHLANVPREQIQDLRPDPLVTWDSEPPSTPTLR